MRRKWQFLQYFFLISIPCLAFSQNVKEESFESNQKVVARTIELAKGNEAFKNLFFKEHEQEFLRLVIEGQSPKVLFIGCSDSRVVPELIAETSPGKLFVIRTAGNFVPVYDPNMAWDGVGATIEYAIKELQVTDIIVCGHSHCGAIQGLYAKPGVESKFQLLPKWLKFGLNAKILTDKLLNEKVSEKDRLLVTERLSVLLQLDHLLSFPFVKEKVEEKKVYLHGWHYSIERGEISYFDPENYKFIPLSSLIRTTDEKK